MITTDFVPGSPCWLDLGAPDTKAATEFYRSVFGWEFRPMSPDSDDYGAFQLGGKTVAGLGRLTEEGARSAWMIYFSVPDADAATETVRQSGGTVRVPPMDAGGEGRMAQYTDPQGGQFAVWQPGGTKGVDAVDQTGTLSWTELYTTDMAGAKEFYGNLFGWRTQDMDLPGGGGTYTLITPSGQADERMHGGMMQLPAEHLALTGGKPYWHPVFATADCDATVDKVMAGGGRVMMGPEDAEGVGRLAVCVDPAGADFVVLTPEPGPQG
ncbi:VOC family protein [Streptomyces thermolilacinus]|uniref:Hydroxylase n=1 Tax=Streptomyces thermolilacinus SPC6 TaxID=1306406 RepID=A0A1D3DZ66_9ACTN|nr:VOC family protein [Streptomyces thermolilacinus]OEJ97605.1 hydroxylase [Streptomyces thermolilacinus SPC6]